MLEDKLSGRKPRWSARLAVGFGVVATLAANVDSAHPTIDARLVAAAAPVEYRIRTGLAAITSTNPVSAVSCTAR